MAYATVAIEKTGRSAAGFSFSAQAGAHAGVVEEFDAVHFKRSADRIKVTAAHAGNDVEFFRARDG